MATTPREAWQRYMPQGIVPDKKHKCVLHKVHVPEPLILEGHHVIPKGMQKETGVLLPKWGEVVWVCPTGHANIHMRVARLLRGEVLRGRRDVTGRLAMRAFYWYKDNIGKEATIGEEFLRGDSEEGLED